jgi:hypothetical protein
VPWEWPVGALCAFLLALATTPAGVSGAVLLLPIQLNILHVAGPGVTPKRGIVETLLAAGVVGVILALAGAPLP